MNTTVLPASVNRAGEAEIEADTESTCGGGTGSASTPGAMSGGGAVSGGESTDVIANGASSGMGRGGSGTGA